MVARFQEQAEELDQTKTALEAKQAIKSLIRVAVWEWQRPWLQPSGSTDFCFLVVIFFGSSSANLNFLNFLGE
jgi:hypothetical protein